jgi:Flp pilus assembly protein CpaB
MKNRKSRGIIISLLIAVLAAVGLFTYATLTKPQTMTVVATKIDIPAGTRLDAIDKENLVAYPLNVVGQAVGYTMVSTSDYDAMAPAGGVFIKPVKANEFLLLSNIAAPNNPLQTEDPMLAQIDPGLVNQTISFTRTDAPLGVSVGDTVNIILTLNQGDLEEDFYNNLATITKSHDDYINEKEDILDSVVEDNQSNTFPELTEDQLLNMTDEELWEYSVAKAEAESGGTYTNSDGRSAEDIYYEYANIVYAFAFTQPPYSRTLIRGAEVTGVICDYATNPDGSYSTCIPTLVSVLVPEEYSEDIEMADNAGSLAMTINSRTATFDSYEPITDGATKSEFLREFIDVMQLFDFDNFFNTTPNTNIAE